MSGNYDDQWIPSNSMPQATFTVQLGCLIDNGFDVGMKDYPIYDESYRNPLNQKIFNHFWFREIGQETPELFKRFLNRKMNEIMPFYNQLYESTLLKFDPLINNKIVTTNKSEGTRTDQREAVHNETSTTDANTNAKSDSDSKSLVSDFPQMRLSGSEDYASALTETTGASDNESSSNETNERSLKENDQNASKTTDSYINEIIGLSGITASQALMDFRSSMLNIDMMIIEELSPLFFGLYSNTANYL